MLLDVFAFLFSSAHLGVNIVAEQNRLEETQRKIFERTVSDEAWELKHTDKELETQLLENMSDPSCFETIRSEVCSALAEMPAWADRKDCIFIRRDLLPASKSKADEKLCASTVIRERNIALDILLANRGKVSVKSAGFGYDSFSGTVHGGKCWDQVDELVQWIQSTLRSKGAEMELFCKRNGSGVKKYVWVGSHTFNSSVAF